MIFERIKWCKNAEKSHKVSVRCTITSQIYAYGGPCGAARFASVVVYLRLRLWNWSEGQPLISVRLATFTKAYHYLHDVVCEVKRGLLFFKERMGGWILSQWGKKSQSWLFFCKNQSWHVFCAGSSYVYVHIFSCILDKKREPNDFAVSEMCNNRGIERYLQGEQFEVWAQGHVDEFRRHPGTDTKDWYHMCCAN